VTAFSVSSPRAAPSGPTPAGVIGTVIVSSVTILALFVAAVTFFALAIAFPIAVSVAPQYNIPVSAADVALAERFAGYWWVFAGFGLASLVSAAVVTLKAVEHMDGRRQR